MRIPCGRQLIFWGAMLLCGARAHAQGADTLQLLRRLPFAGSFITDDHLGNLYLINSDNELVKYDSTGRFVALYSNRRLGAAAAVDASNPFKVLLWYPDFQTAVLLDRTLSELGALYLPSAGLGAVRSIASASDGNIWAFDELSSRVVRLDWNGAVLLESQPLRDFFPNRFLPLYLQDDGRRLCLQDPAGGICILNLYGGIEKADPFTKTKGCVVKSDWLWLLDTGRLLIRHLGHFQEEQLILPEWCSRATDFRITPHSVFVTIDGQTAQFRMEGQGK